MLMSNRFIAAATVVALAPAIGASAAKPKPQPVDGKIEWVYDYDQGKQLSESTGKPMFVVFRCER